MIVMFGLRDIESVDSEKGWLRIGEKDSEVASCMVGEKAWSRKGRVGLGSNLS